MFRFVTGTTQLTLTADQEQAVIDKRKLERLAAQNRFTVANRQRKKNATGDVRRLSTDKDGIRHVTAPDDDLLDGGAAALAELVGQTNEQQQMF